VLFVVGLFVFAVILCVGIPSYHLATSSRAVSGALRDARSVTLSEFVQYFDMSGSELARRERVLSTVSASDEQVRQLERATAGIVALGFPLAHKLCFDPHHRIQVVRPDGSDLRLDICFQCDNFRLGDGAIQTLPRPWLPRLAEFFAAAGIPVRAAEEYSKLHPN
jgi:hypothetical protein